MDDYQHLRDSADAAAALADLDILGIGFGEPVPQPRAAIAERHFGIPVRLGSESRWDDAMRHSDARRGYTAGVGVR